MESTKMILNLEDALVTINVGETKEDILNEVSVDFFSLKHKLDCISKLALNASKSHIAFGMDSGIVGVIDLSNNSITKLESKHDSVSDKCPRSLN